MSEIYKRIRARREELGMSQEELAKKMGYKSRSSINKIESGTNDIPQSKVEAFAKALQTTTFYLMGGDEPSSSPLSPYSQTEKDPHLTALIERAQHSQNIGIVMNQGKGGQKIIPLTPQEAQKLDEFYKDSKKAGVLFGFRQTENALIELNETEYETLKGMLEIIRKNRP